MNWYDGILERFKIICRDKPEKIINVIPEKRKIFLHKENYFWEDQSDLPEIYDLDEMVFKKVINLIRNEIESRKDPASRSEHWECKDIDGIYSIKIESYLLRSRLRQNESIDDLPFYCH